MFLAGKVEETPKKCRDIIKTARNLLTDAQFEAFGEDPKVSTTVNQLDFGQKNHTFMLITNIIITLLPQLFLGQLRALRAEFHGSAHVRAMT